MTRNNKHTVFDKEIAVENEYVRIRPLKETDVSELRTVFDIPLTEEKAEEMVALSIGAFQRKEEGILAVIAVSDDSLKGFISLYTDTNDSIRIGYRIRKEDRNRHYASEAVYLLTSYLCKERNVEEVHALVKEDNTWSLRLLRHNGYEKTDGNNGILHYIYFYKEPAVSKTFQTPEGKKTICAAGGCFWGTERIFQVLNGIEETECGYANGFTDDPHYEDVCTRETGYKEAVLITYDPNRISLKKILKAFFMCIDPTVKDRQGEDIGSQYQTGIYYTDESDLPVLEQYFEEEKKKYDSFFVELEGLRTFYTAEEYHQKYLDKFPDGYCHIPAVKLEEVKKLNEEEI